MLFTQRVWVRLQRLFRRERAAQLLDDELQFHLDEQIAENVASGMSEQDARYAAKRAFGNSTMVKEETRESWGWIWLEQIGQDLRYGFRALRKAPGFTAVAVVTLALGIGADTTICSLVDASLLRPLPFTDPAHLVMVFNHFPDLDEGPASYADFQDWRNQNQVFEDIAAMFPRNLNWTGRGEPEQVRAGLVSDRFFSVTGTQAAAGRLFLPRDQAKGAESVCVLSYRLWQTYLGGQSEVIGKALLLSGKSYTVVGIMPASLASDFSPWAKIDLWIPLETDPPWNQRGTNYLNVVARLKQGITLERARTDMDLIQDALNAHYPGNKHDVRVVSLTESLVRNARPILLVLFAAVGFVLLIACVNVANLLLVRTSSRTREFAIRQALGSGRPRLYRQLMIESLLLGSLGGIAGIFTTVWGVRLLNGDLFSTFTPVRAAGIDHRVLGFTVAVTLVAALLFGMIPAFHASRVNLNQAFKEGAPTGSEGKSRRVARGALIVVEIAAACVLLVGAGLALKSIVRLGHVATGFHPQNVLTLNISLPGRRYNEDSKITAFYQQLLDRVGALPGVLMAGAVTNLPLEGTTTGDFKIKDRVPFPAGQKPTAEKEIASPGYFEAMQIPLIQGRSFLASDGPTAPKVVVISQSMARQFWPGQNPIGQYMDAGFGRQLPNGQPDWQEIVGVIQDVKYDSLEQTSGLALYLCSLQYPASMALVVRTAGEPLQMAQTVREQVFAVDPDQPVYGVESMDQIVDKSIDNRRAPSYLLEIFAALATLLAAVGVYGVMSYSSSQRSHEIGIRMALGAQRKTVLRLVLAQAARLTLLGVVIGLAAALALTRLMKTLLYGVSATDPLTFVGVAILLVSVALAASYIPARRALRVDPMVALRYE